MRDIFTIFLNYTVVICSRSEPYPSMKLMFVGVSNIGKSTLLGKLRGDVYVGKGWHERRETKKTPSTLSSDFVRSVQL